MSHPYWVNTPRIVYETIDDETVIIDFDTGAYYSVRGVSNRIWLLLCEGKNRAQIVKFLTSYYTVEENAAAEDTERFIAELSRLSLVVASSTLGSQLSDDSIPAQPTSGQAQQAYQTPILEQFTDMQELLLLDPIHDVNEQGWPHRP